jgi:hypothetical protein
MTIEERIEILKAAAYDARRQAEAERLYALQCLAPDGQNEGRRMAGLYMGIALAFERRAASLKTA